MSYGGREEVSELGREGVSEFGREGGREGAVVLHQCYAAFPPEALYTKQLVQMRDVRRAAITSLL